MERPPSGDNLAGDARSPAADAESVRELHDDCCEPLRSRRVEKLVGRDPRGLFRLSQPTAAPIAGMRPVDDPGFTRLVTYRSHIVVHYLQIAQNLLNFEGLRLANSYGIPTSTHEAGRTRQTGDSPRLRIQHQKGQHSAKGGIRGRSKKARVVSQRVHASIGRADRECSGLDLGRSPRFTPHTFQRWLDCYTRRDKYDPRGAGASPRCFQCSCSTGKHPWPSLCAEHPAAVYERLPLRKS